MHFKTFSIYLFLSLLALNPLISHSGETSADETVQWLAKKLNSYFVNVRVTGVDGYNYANNIESFSVKNDVLKIEMSVTVDGQTTKKTFSSDLNKLSPKVSVTQFAPQATTIPPAATVQLNTVENKVFVSFLIGDIEFANRIGKAFEHLLTLKGGNKEPF